MKDTDILCGSEASTAISSTNMDIIEEASSSSSSSLSSAAIELGGRTLDRHNPIISDGRRNAISNSTGTLLTPPHDFSHPHKTPSKPYKNSKTKNPHNRISPKLQSSTLLLNKSSFVAKLSALVAPPPPPPPVAGSSRYLLGTDIQSHFFDGSPEFDTVSDAIAADEGFKSDENQNECSSSTALDSVSHPENPTPIKQVVVLTVSLHCKGCEGKVRKHLSRMKGVTSFNIDYAAKKVTIEGDVTPVGVLASVSKLKHAKFSTSQPPPPPPSTSATVEIKGSR